jgi:tetratricopeptide (TPR) repeat protein
MLLRMWCRALCAVLLLAWCGCDPGSEAQVDEQKNPFFAAGKERIGAHDYKGAIEAFEKALETNPKSVLAHFELGVLYEQHSEQKDSDYIAAMYHYQQVIRLRPTEYPADNARQRIAGCKQELVKGEALAPVAQNLVRENDRLKEENRGLHRQLDSMRADLNRVAAGGAAPALAAQTQGSTAQADTAVRPRTNAAPGVYRVTPAAPSASAIASSSKNHTIQPGDTAYSIAKRYRVSVNSLLTANPRMDPRRMKVGAVVAIPPS